MSSPNGNRKKNNQLGMPFGTATARLRKQILFSLLQRHGENICFRCGKPIVSANELSTEHKIAWLDNDVALFWDMDNIAFSHPRCNAQAANHAKPRTAGHGTVTMYKHGCRCVDCRRANADNARRKKANKKTAVVQ